MGNGSIETINLGIQTVRELSQELPYKYHDIIDDINKALEAVWEEANNLAVYANREHEMASKLRKMHGATFAAECDAAGIW